MLPDEAFFYAVALPHSQNFLKGEPREHPESSVLSHTANSVLLFPITNLINKPIKKEKTIITQRFFPLLALSELSVWKHSLCFAGMLWMLIRV